MDLLVNYLLKICSFFKKINCICISVKEYFFIKEFFITTCSSLYECKYRRFCNYGLIFPRAGIKQRLVIKSK